MASAQSAHTRLTALLPVGCTGGPDPEAERHLNMSIGYDTRIKPGGERIGCKMDEKSGGYL